MTHKQTSRQTHLFSISKEAESRPDKIESTSNNVQVRKKQQHRRRACDLLASLKRFYWPIVQYQTHTTPLLQGVGIPTISQSVNVQSLDLLCQCLLSDSNTSEFYCYLLSQSQSQLSHTLVGCINNFIKDKDIDVLKYVFNNEYRKAIKLRLTKRIPDGTNGMLDSIRYLLNNYTDNNRAILNVLLKVFY